MEKAQVERVFQSVSALRLLPLPAIPDPAIAGAIEDVCARPEFTPLLPGIEFGPGNLGDVPFRVMNATRILLNEVDVDDSALTAFHLRHALELTTLLQLFPEASRSPGLAAAIMLVGLSTALSYYAQLMDYEQQVIEDGVPPWLRPLLTFAREGHLLSQSAAEVCAYLSGFLEFLMPLQDSEHAIGDEVGRMAEKMMPFAHPVEQLLTLGGDDRLCVQSHTGLNEYGCSPRPRPWAITFSSSTASSISDYGYAQAEALRQRLLVRAVQGDLTNCYHDEAQVIREKLSAILNLGRSGAEVILTSSGTDAELFGLYFAAGDVNRRVLNILVGPAEIGSGSLEAAGGRHFNTSTPVGGDVEPGEPVIGLAIDGIRVEHIPLRRDDGSVIPMQEIESLIHELTEAAVVRDETVLVHLLDCSKTGLLAPSLECAKRLRSSLPDHVHILVDAAQMRISRRLLNRYLEEGFMVFITGSKFFTGPPFSAAFLVPETMLEHLSGLKRLPKGFSDYATAHDFPPRFQHLGEQLSGKPNIGLLFRWQAALWEMSAFFAVQAEDRFQTIKQFGKAVLEAIRQTPELSLVAAPPRPESLCEGERRWDCLPSIFTIYLHATMTPDHPPRILSYEESRRAYAYLNQDIADLLPKDVSENELEIARHRCHSGRPVRICKVRETWRGGLRISAGARLVSGVCFDPMLGNTPAERLAREIADMRLTTDKLAMISRYWYFIIRAEEEGGPRSPAVFR